MKPHSSFAFILVCLLFLSKFSFASHGFAWSSQANFSGTKDLTGQYNYNSSGSSIKVTYESTGTYFVSFEGLGSSFSWRGGHAQVTSYGSGKAHCKVSGWNRFQKFNVWVSCYNALGNKVDSQFTISVRNPDQAQTSYAYTYANEDDDAEYSGEDKYTKSPGNGVLLKRSSEGSYTAVFKNVASYLSNGGHIQVTSVGNNSDSCQVKSWLKYGSDVHVNVRCFSAGGFPEDSEFFVHLTTQATHDEDSMKAAYAWGSNPTSSNYTAHSHYSNPTANIQRLGQGSYKVTFNSLVGFGKTNVHVTSYGSEAMHCKVQYWSRVGSKVSSRLFCFDDSGVMADSNFAVRLVHK